MLCFSACCHDLLRLWASIAFPAAVRLTSFLRAASYLNSFANWTERYPPNTGARPARAKDPLIVKAAFSNEPD
jgi:hypothetical protein